MDFIIKQAYKFAEETLMYGPGQYERIINETRTHVANIDNHLDKIKFLNTVLEYNSTSQENHSRECLNRDGDCDKDFGYESISYYLTQELNKLGVQINSDAFTTEEKKQNESKLDEILIQIELLKTGQQVLFAEIDELRNLYFLGKKNWYQLLIGKTTEMVASGIISLTVSEKIVESLNHLPALLPN